MLGKGIVRLLNNYQKRCNAVFARGNAASQAAYSTLAVKVSFLERYRAYRLKAPKGRWRVSAVQEAISSIISNVNMIRFI